MIERYKSESPHTQIAQKIELQAGLEFGPEKLTKADVARALNLTESDISDEEWNDISEFAVNAGAVLFRAAVENDIPETPTRKDLKTLDKRIKKNKDNLLPYHDLFHAAETYRLTKGGRAAARFAEVSNRERYTDPHAAVGELYPLLFYAKPENPGMTAPLSVLLQSPEGRKVVEDFFMHWKLPEDATRRIQHILTAAPQSTLEARQRDYESLIEVVILANTEDNIKDLTPAEAESIQKGFVEVRDNPPEHYARFARRVFNEEWKTNPRLFLDELLDCIRTKPE
jgi:hypothetical protein